MKAFLTACGIFAIVSPSLCQRVCNGDDVLLSLSAAQHFASKMQLLTDVNNNNIDPSGPIYNNFIVESNHLTQDLQCNVTVTSTEQLAICSAYESFALVQLGYLHVADGLRFYQQNGQGDNAAKMHGYIVQAGEALGNYTSQLKAISPSCVARIDAAYAPLGVQLTRLLDAYPAR